MFLINRVNETNKEIAKSRELLDTSTSQLQQYLYEIYGVVFVVDSSEPERFDECRESLATLLSHPHVRGKPLLLLANKQDKVGVSQSEG